jgi:bifunctional non-homologous end joining protein LigD
MPRFVIQEHYATSHHLDLRLDKDGVLVSSGVPEGMSLGTPEETQKNRLTMRVEDHDLSHLPVMDGAPVEGVPGAMRKRIRKRIRDWGTYEAEQFGEEMVLVRLYGRRLDVRYAIFRAGENWLVQKIKPPGEARD